MKQIVDQGIAIGPEDGEPIRSGNYLYWSPQFANIVREYLADYLPQADVSGSPNGGAFTTRFAKRDRSGREECSGSSSFLDPKAKILKTDADKLVAAIDRFHAVANDPSASPDAAAFIRGFMLPDPAEMPEAWRIPAKSGEPRVLWGWKKHGPRNSTFLPLTPTSAKWPDAADRRDVTVLLEGNRRLRNSIFYSWPWRVFLGAAAIALFVLLACLLLRSCPKGRFGFGDGRGTNDVPVALGPTNAPSGGETAVPDDTGADEDGDDADEATPDGVAEDPDAPAGDDSTGPDLADAVKGLVTDTVGLVEGLVTNVQGAIEGLGKDDDGDDDATDDDDDDDDVADDDDNDDTVVDDDDGDDDDVTVIDDDDDDTVVDDDDDDDDDDVVTIIDDDDDDDDDVTVIVDDDDDIRVRVTNAPVRVDPVAETCPIHKGVELVDGVCPERCPVCARHLEKDGGTRCPNTCDKHPGTHLKNGLCPKCHESPMETVEDWVNLHEETERDGRFYPVFDVRTRITTATQKEEWLLDGEAAEGGYLDPKGTWKWSPPDGFGPDETHEIGAVSTKMIDGRAKKITARPYVWTHKPPPPEQVERTIVGCGNRLDRTTNREYFLVRLFSTPEDNRAEVVKWTADLDGTPVPCRKDADFTNATRLYKQDFPRDGVVTVKAVVRIGDSFERELTASFLYKAGMLHSDGVDDTDRMDAVTTLYSVCGPSIFLCAVPDRGTGTAFAVTKRDLITSAHVVGDKKSVVLCKEDGRRIAARVMKTDEGRDLAWLRADGTDFAPLALDADGSTFRSIVDDVNDRGVESSADVAALGYPYWAEDQEPSKDAVPAMSRALGKIQGSADGSIVHSALISHGNSGGPLLAMNGVVLGVTDGALVHTEKGSETIVDHPHAIKAELIPKAFPALFAKRGK